MPPATSPKSASSARPQTFRKNDRFVLHSQHRRRSTADARCDRAERDQRLVLPCFGRDSPEGGLQRRRTRPRRHRVAPPPDGALRQERGYGPLCLLSGCRHLRSLHPPGRRACLWSIGVLHRLHALSARSLAGCPPEHLRVPEPDLTPDRHGSRERLVVRWRDRPRRGRHHGLRPEKATGCRPSRERSSRLPGRGRNVPRDAPLPNARFTL